MDFGKAFSYQFSDEEWVKKILITGLIFLIPVFGQLYGMGWMLGVMKRVQDNHPAPLPDDFDFGGNFIRGLKAFVIALVYSIPIFIFTAPMGVGSTLLSTGGENTETMGVVFSIISVCCSGLIFIYSILLTLIMPAIYGLFNENESIGAAFQIGEVFNLLKPAIGPFLLALVGAIIAGIIGSLGSVVCLIGIIFTMPYSYSIIAHFYAQAYQQAVALKQ